MEEMRRDRTIGCDRARNCTLLLASMLMSATLTACGGDSDSAPAAAAAPPATTAPPAAVAPPASAPPPAAVAPPSAAPPPTAAVPPASSGESEGLAGVSSAPGSTTLSWMPPTANEDGTPLTLTGYKIYWGLTEDNYPHSVTLANPGLTRHVVEQLSSNTWYFVATALSADGESPPSNVVRMQIR